MEAFLETTLPVLFFFKSLAFRPPTVFTLRPLSTWDLAILPLAILETFMAFMRRIMLAFLAFIMERIFFMPEALAFIIDFIFIAMLTVV